MGLLDGVVVQCEISIEKIVMAIASKTRSMLEGLVRESSFKWLLSSRRSFEEDFEEFGKSPSARKNWIAELSPAANIIVRRCSKIIGIPSIELQESFNAEAFDSIRHPSNYAKNFLEYCCFRALALSTQVTGYLSDKKFRKLTYDMMLAWEAPAASSQPSLKLDEEASVGLEAFSRIAAAVPLIANVIISENLFKMLTSSAGGRLGFFMYDKYLSGLERAIRKMKNQSESSLLDSVRSSRGEKVLEVDGTVTTRPVLEHVGISTWPGRLTLTDHALYFEPIRVVSYDKAKVYDLSDDLKQVVKPELTGPLGTRLFDKAVSYKSVSLSESVMLEFPELKGHARRDYWLGITREILYAHRFVNMYQIRGVQRDEAILKAVLGILRVQAIRDVFSTTPLRSEALLMFSLCDQLPGGDLILETLAQMSKSREFVQTNTATAGSAMYSISVLDVISNLGFGLGATSSSSNDTGIVVGEIAVGTMTTLERVVKESHSNYEKVVLAQSSVNGVKVDGIDTNLAVMKELLFPVIELGRFLLSLTYWDDPLKSLVFLVVFSFIIFREWLSYAVALTLLFLAFFMVLTRFYNRGRPIDEVKVVVPPPMNRMEQLLVVQNVISQAGQVIQDGNIVLLKLRALLLSIFPQATEKIAFVLLMTALALAFVPNKYIILVAFMDIFTMSSPARKGSTEKWTRRLREWWFSIPAAPVILERKEKEEKKRK